MDIKKQITGENTVWDGPLSQDGRPHGKGSSSGITGMKLKFIEPTHKAGPITQVAKKQKVLNMSDIKLYSLNTITLSVTTFSDLEMGLKILLLSVSIGYTLNRWVRLSNNKNKQEQEQEQEK